MSLKRFGVRNFRCFDSLDCELADINIVVGSNGAGKTSLLEAVFLLSRGRSFRGGNLKHLRREGAASFEVFGVTQGDFGEKRFGVQYRDGGLHTRVNAASVENRSILTDALPVLVIEPHSHQLIEGDPGTRREFANWGAFHVEHQFLSQWRRFRRLLSQRNALLKQSGNAGEFTAWDQGYVEAALKVDTARRFWLQRFSEILPHEMDVLLPGHEISVDYRQGWRDDVALGEALQQSLVDDRERGFTTKGPHRAELRISCDGVLARERVSRGQQKLLAIAMMLTQAKVFAEQRSDRCLLLVDDPAAELDNDRLARLLMELSELDAQIIITGTDEAPLMTEYNTPAKVFHVEQGQLREVL